MSTYAVSFKLASDSTYHARYESLMGQIRACNTVWTETTSFALVSTNESISELENRLYFRTLLLTSTDLLVVIDVSGAAATIRGTNSYPHTLRALLPRITEM
ncbi:hypothetical protein [Sphingomonas sp. OK281]|uniref:hypothetical protein n=1 Tax=Sphingomonas sp. OK281 TaxID=1881067 RepID=UPI0008F39043|nr:hypothetical protein [Sphingomonas sp. OK281]SFO01756.1 hypothetical protein SAMN05428984_1642 [Sphingomonas sp. OK281]